MGKIKKTLAAIVLAGASLLGLRGEAKASVIFQDNFDSYPTNSTPAPPWIDGYGPGNITRKEAETAGVTIKVEENFYTGSSGKSVHFLDMNKGTFSQIEHTFPSSSKVTLEYYMMNDKRGYEGAMVCLSGPTDQDTDYMVGFGGVHAFIGVHGYSTGWIKGDLLPFEEGKWYYVRRELDCLANTGTFYVQDVLDASKNATFEIGMDRWDSSVNRVWITTSGKKFVDCYIDNIRVSDTNPEPPIPPEPSTLALLGFGAGALALRKRRK